MACFNFPSVLVHESSKVPPPISYPFSRPATKTFPTKPFSVLSLFRFPLRHDRSRSSRTSSSSRPRLLSASGCNGRRPFPTILRSEGREGLIVWCSFRPFLYMTCKAQQVWGSAKEQKKRGGDGREGKPQAGPTSKENLSSPLLALSFSSNSFPLFTTQLYNTTT